MKPNRNPQPSIYRHWMCKVTMILFALVASSQTMVAVTPSDSTTNRHMFACAPALEPQVSDGDADGLEATNYALGVVLALDDCQIGLLQLAADDATPQVVVYHRCAATTMPGDATIGPGDNVTMTFLELPNQLLLVTSIQRLPPEDNTATTLAATETSVPVELAVWPPVIILPIIIMRTLQYSANDPTEKEFAACAPPRKERYHPCPADDDEADKVERFTFGKVISLMHQGLIVREFDFAKDADVEAFYEVQAETEFGNISAGRPLHIGDDVVIDYVEEDGRRLVSTIVWEDAVEVTGSSAPEKSGDHVTGASREGVWIRKYCYPMDDR